MMLTSIRRTLLLYIDNVTCGSFDLYICIVLEPDVS